MTAGDGTSIRSGSRGTVGAIGSLSPKEGQLYLVRWDGINIPENEHIAEQYIEPTDPEFAVGDRVRARRRMRAGDGTTIPENTLGSIESVGSITDEGQLYLVKWENLTIPKGERIAELYLVSAGQ